MSKPAIFLERDGILNVEAGYLHNVEDLHLIPGVATALRQLNHLNLFCCLVSNQSGILVNKTLIINNHGKRLSSLENSRTFP